MRKPLTRTATALLLAATAGFVSLVSPPDLISQVVALATSGEGRGDNPVVGSLPCVKEDDLDLKFFNWLGIQQPPGAVQFHRPTVGMLGGPDLESHVLDAQGTPTGMVNAGASWSALGSIRDIQIVADRASAGKNYRFALWVPDSFIGGTATTTSSLGANSFTIGNNAFGLPVAALAALPGPVAGGTMTVTSADGSESCTLQVDVIGGQVIVDFQP